MNAIERFLREFRTSSTKTRYKYAIMKFFDFIGKEADEYIKNIDKKKFREDLLDYAEYLEEQQKAHKISPKSIRLYMSVLKNFCKTYELGIPDIYFTRAIRQLPKSKSIIQDSVPSRKVLREIFQQADVKTKTFAMVLLSSGMRLNEALSLKIEGDKLPNGNIIPHIEKINGYYKINVPTESKGKYSRVTFISSEAKELLDHWLNNGGRDKYIKGARAKTNFNGASKVNKLNDRIFPFWDTGARASWIGALKRSGHNQRCPMTNHHVYHLHTLRKWFITNLDGKISKMALDSLVGHETELDRAYKDKAYQQRVEWLLEEYKQGERFITVYTSGITEGTVQDLELQLKQRDKKLIETNLKMEKIISLTIEKSKLERRLSNGDVDIDSGEDVRINKRLEEIDKELESLL